MVFLILYPRSLLKSEVLKNLFLATCLEETLLDNQSFPQSDNEWAMIDMTDEWWPKSDNSLYYDLPSLHIQWINQMKHNLLITQCVWVLKLRSKQSRALSQSPRGFTVLSNQYEICQWYIVGYSKESFRILSELVKNIQNRVDQLSEHKHLG